jgi:hypothetical protein
MQQDTAKPKATRRFQILLMSGKGGKGSKGSLFFFFFACAPQVSLASSWNHFGPGD